MCNLIKSAYMRKCNICVTCILGAALLVGCRSSKNASNQPVELQQQTAEAEQPTTGNARSLTTQTNLTAHVKVRLSFDGSDIGTGGTLRMRMGEVIQLSINDPFLGISEVGRMEIDPSGVLVIDRYNKRYVSLSYDELNRYARRQLDYETIEYYFWQQALRNDTDELQFMFPVGSKNVGLNLRLSGKNDKSDWDAHTTPPDRYDRVSAEQLFKSLSEL